MIIRQLIIFSVEFTSRGTVELKAFDLAQGAAGHISTIGEWLISLEQFVVDFI
jgi:hypothetical protein